MGRRDGGAGHLTLFDATRSILTQSGSSAWQEPALSRSFHVTHPMFTTMIRLLCPLLVAMSALLRAGGGMDAIILNGQASLAAGERRSGKAEYRVEDGAVVGETAAGTGNSFLCTTKPYGGFIVEIRVQSAQGHGIPACSSAVEYYTKDAEVMIGGKPKEFPCNRVHGYQFEIDPSPRGAFTSLGVYDEARRGWLFDLKNNEPARKAFKSGDWNTGRIECQRFAIGRRSSTACLAADLKDSLNRQGCDCPASARHREQS